MSAARLASLVASALLFTAPLFAQTTWIVDDDGGTGVDFTTLTAAVSAASSGDRILIHSGSYPGDITTSKGLTILSTGPSPNAYIAGSVTFHDVPRGQRVRLCDLRLFSLDLERCYGTVVATKLRVDSPSGPLGGAAITDCANVRFTDCQIWGWKSRPGVTVRSSRVEFTSCYVRGGWGNLGQPHLVPGEGTRGMVVADRAIVSLGCSVVDGGDGSWNLPGGWGAPGGLGMLVEPTARVHARSDGPASVNGGRGGLGSDRLGKQDGWGGMGVVNDGWMLRSNTYFIGGHEGFETEGPAYGGIGVVIDQDPHFPALRATVDAAVAGEARLRVSGEPGDAVSLLVGERAAINTVPGFDPILLIDIDDVVFIGTIPANGELLHTFDAPAGWVPGDLVALQAMVLTAEGYRLSNSAAVVLR